MYAHMMSHVMMSVWAIVQYVPFFLPRILKPGGQVFFREAHFTSVGSRVQTDDGNPAIYRSIMVSLPTNLAPTITYVLYMYYTILYYAMLYYTCTIYYTILCYAVLYMYYILYYTMLCCTIHVLYTIHVHVLYMYYILYMYYTIHVLYYTCTCTMLFYATL